MPPEPSETSQAKILQSRAARTLFVVILLGAALLGLRWYQGHKNDAGDVFNGPVSSAGMVEAIQYGDDGDHVVAFNEKGEKVAQKSVVPGTHDADPVWRPDGNRIFFVSDRDKKSYQLYRWVPTPNNDPEQRSEGSLGKSHPAFPLGTADSNAPMLFISGGFVDQFDPSNLKGHQVLPPLGTEVTMSKEEDAEGSGGQMSGIYGQLGDRFRVARWVKGTDAIVAVMGSDRGEVLIYQDLVKTDEKLKDPVPLANGTHIDFDVSPVDGAIVFTVQNYAWLSTSKVPPDQRFRHCISIWRPGDQSPEMLLPSRDDSISFGSPAISPAGDKVLVVEGNYNRSSETLESKALMTMPTAGRAAAAAAKLTDGAVYEPAWNPKGDTIAYAKNGANGSRAIYVCGADGSNEHTLTGDTGTYGHPLFSPQTH